MRLLTIPAVLLASAAFIGAANAKSARCYTTDDGEYDCEFVLTDNAGSFEISAPEKPTFSLQIESQSVGWAYGDYGDGSVALPGRFERSRNDPACWVSYETGAEICAW